MIETWWLLDSGPCEPMFNMALDEALLRSVHELGRPVLRFYAWTEPAASFGYFQRIADVERATQLRPLVRRPTAGGIVPHNADWTYSLTIPAGHEWHGVNAECSYHRLHDWLRRAFTVLGVETELSRKSSRPVGGQCFVGCEVHDLLWRGRKIAGAAQRRTRTGLLIQGSVQPPPLNLDRGTWQQALCDLMPVKWQRWNLSDAVLRQCDVLLATKHTKGAYQNKR